MALTEKKTERNKFFHVHAFEMNDLPVEFYVCVVENVWGKFQA